MATPHMQKVSNCIIGSSQLGLELRTYSLNKPAQSSYAGGALSVDWRNSGLRKLSFFSFLSVGHLLGLCKDWGVNGLMRDAALEAWLCSLFCSLGYCCLLPWEDTLRCWETWNCGIREQVDTYGFRHSKSSCFLKCTSNCGVKYYESCLKDMKYLPAVGNILQSLSS